MWLKHKVTASEMRFDAAVLDELNKDEDLVGQASGAVATFIDKAEDNLSLRFVTVDGVFEDGEDVIAQGSGVTFTLATTDAITLGDVDNDTGVDIVDALLVAQYYVGLNPQGFDSANADVNCDGGIDIVDALLIAQYYVGLLAEFC